MPNFKYQQQFYESSNKGNVVPSFQDRLDSQLSQNIALLLVDKNFENADNLALFALTSIMKEYLVEIGTEMKGICEAQGRTEANLIDALNAAYDYGLPQSALQEHMNDINALTLAPMQ